MPATRMFPLYFSAFAGQNRTSESLAGGLHAGNRAAVHPTHSRVRRWQRSVAGPARYAEEATKAAPTTELKAADATPGARKMVDRGNTGASGRRGAGRRLAHASDRGQQRRIGAAF